LVTELLIIIIFTLRSSFLSYRQLSTALFFVNYFMCIQDTDKDISVLNYAMKANGGMEIQLHTLTLLSDGGKLSASGPGCFASWENTTQYQFNGMVRGSYSRSEIWRREETPFPLCPAHTWSPTELWLPTQAHIHKFHPFV
jgi:hypothetical protein